MNKINQKQVLVYWLAIIIPSSLISVVFISAFVIRVAALRCMHVRENFSSLGLSVKLNLKLMNQQAKIGVINS